MALDRVFSTPKVEVDQDRYEELIRHELQYEQYKQQADTQIIEIIETNIEIKLEESEENKDE